MPKVLIIEPCLINHGDDAGGTHQDAGDVVECSKDNAMALMRAGRALYINKTDDPDKQGRNTATREMLKAAEAMATATAKSKTPSDA